MFWKKRIYLDFAAATPVLPQARWAMWKYWSKEFFNPSSIYKEGTRIRKEIETIREKFAENLGVKKRDIIFTSGGTESNNLAILGVLKFALDPSNKSRPILRPHIILSEAEHSSIIELVDEISRLGGQVSIAKRNEKGLITPESIEKLLKPNTVLVSISFADSQTGLIEPISRIGRHLRARRKKLEGKYPYFHTDASQVINFLDLNLQKQGVNLMTLDSSKIYGPRGIGILALTSDVDIRPIILGGGQERGLRSGTENTALIKGFSTAWNIIEKEREIEKERLTKLKQFFIHELKKKLPKIEILGTKSESLPNFVSVFLPDGVLSELVVLDFDRRGIAISAGSACLAGGNKPEESLIRFSFGRTTTKNELRYAIKTFARILNRDKIPLW